MKKIKYYSFLTFVIFITGMFSMSCGEKKTDITQKNDNVNQKQMTTNTTQKVDTTQPLTENESDTVIMETSMGSMTIELYSKDAPLHVANFKKLVKDGFYDGLLFHRVIPGFMIQGGDPNTKSGDRSTYGQGGPGYTIPAEIKLKHEMGSLAAARLGDAANPKRESSGSQFYIVTGNASHLDGQYTVYGKVIKGIDIAHKIENVKRDAMDDPIDKVVITKVSFAR
jgi:peptidyl-prolyl cis-trans isomerase B (cyclophilin B)